MEDDVRQRVIRKFMALPEDKQQKLCDAMGELMAKLKVEWEAKPENAGKTVKYAELWENSLTQSSIGDRGKPPTPSRPIDLAGGCDAATRRTP